MSGRTQALMRTRCPACATVFRVTSEQLRLKAGKVRCGHCQTVFNAFDEFLPEEPGAHAASGRQPSDEGVSSAVSSGGDWPANVDPSPTLAPEEFSATIVTPTATAERLADDSTAAAAPMVSAVSSPAIAAESAMPTAADEPSTENHPSSLSVASDVPEALVEVPASPQEQEPARTAADGAAEATAASPQATTEAARAAGLVAARELSESPGYNRWAAGTLADGGGSFAPPPSRRLLWPFVLVALLLAIGLLGQMLMHWRSDVVRWLPATAEYYALADIDVPLPRQADWIVIEASDLQADNARGLFVLQATLHNRAPYAQDWPALELTLTDAGDQVVARRVIPAVEYLPSTISPEVFPANGEVAVRLWIEARDLGAAGYRLYVFYP